MSIIYKGIELEGLDKQVGMVHSVVMASMGQDENVNTDYLHKLAQFKREDLPEAQFDEINKLFSVVKMNYQICNGGIYQYFDNGYHKHYISSDKENEIFDKDVQVQMLRKLYDFADEVFPENRVENSRFLRIIEFFDSLEFEEGVPIFDMIYSEEEEQIWDEELEEWVENPDYEEPYEDVVEYENEVRSTNSSFGLCDFDEDYYQVNEYLEKIIETYAQYLDKSIEKELDFSVDAIIQGAVEKAGECVSSNKCKDLELE